MKDADFDLATYQEIIQEIGARLRAQRLQQSLTQSELAALAAVSTSALKTLESTGKSTIETLVRVAGTLGLQSDFLSCSCRRLHSASRPWSAVSARSCVCERRAGSPDEQAGHLLAQIGGITTSWMFWLASTANPRCRLPA